MPGALLKILSNESFDQYQPLMDSTNISGSVIVSDIALEGQPAMLVQADVLLNPRTRCAGIPQKLLNYMATGRVVVSFEGSAKILTDRVDGLVVKNGDIDAFASAMVELAENQALAERLGAAALKLVRERFSWSSTARKTLDVYHETLKNYAEQ
jgi:glycosyltransferase involved in cell wall biosynthesis